MLIRISKIRLQSYEMVKETQEFQTYSNENDTTQEPQQNNNDTLEVKAPKTFTEMKKKSRTAAIILSKIG